MDLISVIIPVYNVEKYLTKCVDSIINQTYKNLEIILVDDGSPDNCGKICDEYAKKDNRIKVIHKENGGLSSARNAGLDICKGEYICFIDSDDFVSLSFIEVLYKMIQINKTDIAQCNFLRFHDENEIANEGAISFEFSQCSIYDNLEMQNNLFKTNQVISTVVWNKLYKRSVYENIRFPNGKIHEDEFTTYIVFSKSENMCYISDELYYYRITDTSITGKAFNKARLDFIDAFSEKKKFYKNNYCHLFNKLVIRYQKYLKEYFFDTQKYISDKKSIICSLKAKLHENCIDYMKCDVPIKNKIKEFIFSYFTDTYYILTRVKDKILKKKE